MSSLPTRPTAWRRRRRGRRRRQGSTRRRRRRRAEKAARRAEETRAFLAEEAAKQAEEAARQAEEAARRAAEARIAQEAARRTEEEARRAREESAGPAGDTLVSDAASGPRLTRKDIVRQRREAAARGKPGTTKPRPAFGPTLDLSVRTSRILLMVSTLIAFGTLLLLFVAYELWGTNIAEARSQKELKHEFAQVVSTSTTTPPATTPGTTTTVAPAHPRGRGRSHHQDPQDRGGEGRGRGRRCRRSQEGTRPLPGTPMPGQPGNAAIAGHRTTYGAPFYRLDELKPGRPIFVTTRQGKFRTRCESRSSWSPPRWRCSTPPPTTG